MIGLFYRILAFFIIDEVVHWAYADVRPQIWLAPLDSAHSERSIGSHDYAALFERGAPWETVAANTNVFKLYPFFTSRSSDEELTKVVRDLQRRGIALALEARALTEEGPCKDDGGSNTLRLLQRLKRLGANLRYLAMDEPMKHWRVRDPRCRASFDLIAENIAKKVRAFREVFPGLQIGDIEPVGQFDDEPEVVSDISELLTAYQHRMNEPIAFFHADVVWNVPWEAVTASLAALLGTRGIPFGIYNGPDTASSDEKWAAEAISHFKRFEQSSRLPDAAIFQSWVAHPTRVLPETDHASLTGIARLYLEHHGLASDGSLRH